MKKLSALLAIFSILALASVAHADTTPTPALPAQCTIDGKNYNEFDFDLSTNKCRLCLPEVSASQWSTTDNPCLCLCGVRRSSIPQTCISEIYFHAGGAWPSPNGQDVSSGGCGRNWCAGGMNGSMCCVTNAFPDSNNYCIAPSDKRISIVPDPSNSTCSYSNPVHDAPPDCPLPLPGQASGNSTNPPAFQCGGKNDRDPCGSQGNWCCKNACVSASQPCPEAFGDFGTFQMHLGDHAELGEYDVFLVDGSPSGLAWLNLSKSGSVISSKIILETGKPKAIFDKSRAITNATLLRTYGEGKTGFTAEIQFLAPQARPTPSAIATPSPSPTPTDENPAIDARKYFNQPPEGCEVFSACGGTPPSDCVEQKAEVAAFSCREAATGKRWKCRQVWESDWSAICPSCPPGFTHDGCKFGGPYFVQSKAYCHKDYESDCASDAGCGSDQTLSEISSCDYVASGLKYCCKTPMGLELPSPTPTPIPLPPIARQAQSGEENQTNAPQKGIVEKIARAVLGPPPLVNITAFVHFPVGVVIPIYEGKSLPIVESADNGAFVEVRAAYKIADKMNCTGPSDCECSPLSRTADTLVNFQCVFHPPVNGTYSLIVRDVQGNDNSEYVHLVQLTPGQSAKLETALEKEKIDLILMFVFALFALAILAVAYFAYQKISAKFLRLRHLQQKKKHLEQEQKMLKYRFMRREISESSYQKLLDAIEKETNQVKVDIVDEMEKQSKRKRWF